MSLDWVRKSLLFTLMFAAASALAQQPTSVYLIPYGPPVTLEQAKKAAAAAAAEMRKNGWLMAIAVVDPHGTLVYYEKTDNAEYAVATLALGKARSAALYKRPTKVFDDGLAKGGAGLRILTLDGASAVEGGVPLMVDGKIIGAIGVSGDLPEHDGQCATAGANAIKQP